jgi:gluconate 5-dehydrogenase
MIQELFSLKGKTALVTGATHGLGMAIARGLAGAGARIVVNDIFQDKLEKAKLEYKKSGIHAETYLFDVTREDQVKSFVARIEEEVAPIDILVNNAGIIKRIPFLEMKAKDFTEVLDVDLTGPFIMSRYVAERMVARGKGGKIINMCSMMSELGRNTVSAYAAAKGGLKMLTRNLATELARHNIQVNGIGPGYRSDRPDPGGRTPVQ